MTAVAGIQSRMSSSRLPGKALMDVCGKPLVQRVYERVRSMMDQSFFDVFVLTSTDESDDVLAESCKRLEIPVRRGPLDDVLSRYEPLGEEYDYIVRVTGDCCLFEPWVLGYSLMTASTQGADLVKIRGNEKGEMDGVLGGITVMSSEVLLRACEEATDLRDREHVAHFWLQEHEDEFQVAKIRVPKLYARPEIKLSVDTQEDLDRIRSIYEAFGPWPFTTEAALKWLDESS